MQQAPLTWPDPHSHVPMLTMTPKTCRSAKTCERQGEDENARSLKINKTAQTRESKPWRCEPSRAKQSVVGRLAKVMNGLSVQRMWRCREAMYDRHGGFEA